MIALTALVFAGPAFAKGETPDGTWDGFVERSGLRSAFAVELTDVDGRWGATVKIDGTTSLLEGVLVEGNNVAFEVPGEGVFVGVVSRSFFVGSVSGGDSSGAFSLMREEDWTDAYGDPIESSGP
jgi:hypothetical protein